MKNVLKIVQDSCISNNPREWDNLGTIAYKSRNYILGDESIDDPIEWLESMLNLTEAGIYTNDRLAELEGKFFEEYIALPLYLYDHSGISLSTSSFSCRWDSGKVGYIYVTKETIRKEYNVKRITKKLRERIEGYLKGEIETFDQYIRGDVYGFIIEDENGDHIDSCYGFYGDNFIENGMLDYIDHELLGITEAELIEQLNSVEIEY